MVIGKTLPSSQIPAGNPSPGTSQTVAVQERKVFNPVQEPSQINITQADSQTPNYQPQKSSNTSMQNLTIGATADNNKPVHTIDQLSSLNPGDLLAFGDYPYAEDGTKKPIEWRTLKRYDDGLLLMTRYGIDCVPYNNTDVDVNWSTCSLRHWLNDNFYHTAFSDGERSLLMLVHNENENSQWNPTTPGGPSTDDYVFALSRSDANEFFQSDEERYCAPTPYAISQTAYHYIGRCWWWLRSPGILPVGAAMVAIDGRCGYTFVGSAGSTVRPAIKVKLPSKQ